MSEWVGGRVSGGVGGEGEGRRHTFQQPHKRHDTCVKHTNELAISIEVTQLEYDFGVFAFSHPHDT